MFEPLVKILKNLNIIDKKNDGTEGAIPGNKLFDALNSSEFLAICPKVTKSLILPFLVFEQSKYCF
jgi:hypothetical protein